MTDSRTGAWLWVADTQQPALQDRHSPGKAVRIGEGGQVTDCLSGCGGGLVGQAQHDNAGMTAGRVGADVTQPAVQGDQDPSRRSGCGDNVLGPARRSGPLE